MALHTGLVTYQMGEFLKSLFQRPATFSTATQVRTTVLTVRIMLRPQSRGQRQTGAVHKFTRSVNGSANVTYTSTYTDPLNNVTTFTTYQANNLLLGSPDFALVSRVTSLDQTVQCYNGATESSVGSATLYSLLCSQRDSCTAPITQANIYHTLGSHRRRGIFHRTSTLTGHRNWSDDYFLDAKWLLL